MSTTTIPQTFSDLYTDLIDRSRANSSDSSTVVLAKRYINTALHDIHITRPWPWAERRAYLNTNAPYNTGTVDIALSARTTVTGSGTLWNTAVTGMGFNNANAGGKMIFSGGNEIYEVSSVGSDTSITLASRYIESAALSAGTYTYFEDEYALASDFWHLIDTRQFSTPFGIEVIGRQDFYRRFPRNGSPGIPRIATIIDLAPSGSVTPRSRVVFHPYPDAMYSIPYRYMTTNLAVSSTGTAATNLSSDTDEPIVPTRYRHAIVLQALVQWYRDRKDDARYQAAMQDYDATFARMAGDYPLENDRPRLVATRPSRIWKGIGRRTRGKNFDVNGAFDRFEI